VVTGQVVSIGEDLRGELRQQQPPVPGGLRLRFRLPVHRAGPLARPLLVGLRLDDLPSDGPPGAALIVQFEVAPPHPEDLTDAAPGGQLKRHHVKQVTIHLRS
jgi:hypothetical protein